MGNKRVGDKIKRIKDKLKVRDWILIILEVISLIGAVITFTGRLYFIYFCFAIIICSFILLDRIISQGKYKIIKYILLFFGTMISSYWSMYFYVCSFPVDGVGGSGIYNDEGEKELQETKGFEKLSVPFRDGKLSGWLYRHLEEPEAPLLIFFCGAGECSADSMTSFYEEGNLMDYLPDYDFLCMDYPGYGNSDWMVYNASMKSMASSIYDKAITLEGIDKSRITVAGYSIGTGPASYLAMKRNVASLILIAPYDRIYHTGDADRTNWYQLVYGYTINPYDYAKKIDEPVLLLTSDADTTCEYKGVKRVADRLDDCQVVKLTGVLHQDMLCDESYQAIKDFLKE